MGDRLLEILREKFGHSQFRRPQREIVESVLAKRDTLAIMPTGGGKSLCYQLPALADEGVALVVSPLIALMKDQVDALVSRGISAAMINSMQSADEQRLALAKLRMGALKLAYIAPERFRMKSFVRSLSGVKISLFAVDEAHCISQWGHDFRPDYMRLGEVLESLGRPPVAAFTATATPDVKEDILVQLKMRNPNVFVSGFARPNLSFNVVEVSSKAEKEFRIRELVEKYKTGIIYCATRKSVETVSEMLWEDGVRHVIYHGGMSPSERYAAQEQFVGGAENIAVATNAFGMGIDRADIRFVCHYELTGSVEAFYQEAGRAGRDGNAAHCTMLMMYADKRVQEFFIDGANPEPEYIRAVYAAIRANSDEGYECLMPVEDLTESAAEKMRGAQRLSGSKKGSANNSMATSSAISVLRKMGMIDRFDIPGMRSRGTRLLQPDIKPSQLLLPAEELLLKRRRDENKLRDVIAFAYSHECRQSWILRYFGETDFDSCGNCDNCLAKKSAQTTQALDSEQIEIVRKALSCVARMSRRVGNRQWAPIFGKTLVQECLAGSKNERILRFGFDKIPTHAALENFGKRFISSLFSEMEKAGFVEVVQGEYPLLGLTEKGVEMMMGEIEKPVMEFPAVGSVSVSSKKSAPELSGLGVKKRSVSVASAETPNPELLKELVALRDKIRHAKKVPAYAIFPNTVLISLSREMPADAEEAMRIKGIGAAKAATVLKPFLEAIKKYAKR